MLVVDARTGVAAAIERIRALERDVTGPSMLAGVGAVLLELGTEHEDALTRLLPTLPSSSRGHRLHVDSDHRFALYLVAEEPAAESPPHCHLTWSVTVCLRGEERHALYRRVGPAEERRARKQREVVLVPGAILAMQADEIHATRVTSPVPTFHVQMYGLDLTEMPDFSLRTFVDSGEAP